MALQRFGTKMGKKRKKVVSRMIKRLAYGESGIIKAI